MTSFQHALIHKAGHDHGFEHVLPSTREAIHLGSALHPVKVAVSVLPQGYALSLTAGPANLPAEIARSFPQWPRAGTAYVAGSEPALGQWLRRVAALAQSLPNQAAVTFEVEVQHALAQLPAEDLQSTEVQRMVRQRIGQDRFRQAMLSYWGGACAVTGLALTPALRASHAKPWAECVSDAERLDVFNGFLLSANMDALFDKFLISFSDEGNLLVSPSVPMADRPLLGLESAGALRWVAPEHLPYLAFHRERFAKG